MGNTDCSPKRYEAWCPAATKVTPDSRDAHALLRNLAAHLSVEAERYVKLRVFLLGAVAP
jgi:hypothetical protein